MALLLVFWLLADVSAFQVQLKAEFPLRHQQKRSENQNQLFPILPQSRVNSLEGLHEGSIVNSLESKLVDDEPFHSKEAHWRRYVDAQLLPCETEQFPSIQFATS